MNIRRPSRRKIKKSKPIKVREMKISEDGKKLIFIEEPELKLEKQEANTISIKSIKPKDDRIRLYLLGYI